MTISLIRWLQIGLIVGMVAAGLLLYPSLPEQIPTHWGFDGTVDDWSPKIYGVWLMPGIALFISLFFPLLKHLDPRRENYKLFTHAWQAIQLALVAFFAYIYSLQLYVTLHPEQADLIGRGVTGGIGVLFMILGNYFGKVRSNYFLGVRTPWTLADTDVWNRTHRLAGWIWFVAGLVVTLHAISGIGQQFAILIGLLVTAALFPIFYSYVIYRAKMQGKTSAQ